FDADILPEPPRAAESLLRKPFLHSGAALQALLQLRQRVQPCFHPRCALQRGVQACVSIAQCQIGAGQLGFLRFQPAPQQPERRIELADLLAQTCELRRVGRLERTLLLAQAIRALRQLVEHLLRMPAFRILDLPVLLRPRGCALQFVVAVAGGTKRFFRPWQAFSFAPQRRPPNSPRPRSPPRWPPCPAQTRPPPPPLVPGA